MRYDIYGERNETEVYHFFTLHDLLKLANKYPNRRFVLYETEIGLSNVASWRGRYSVPSIQPTMEVTMGKHIAEELGDAIGGFMEGYKGGMYPINGNDEFYISKFSMTERYKVVGYTTDGHVVNLLTKLEGD